MKFSQWTVVLYLPDSYRKKKCGFIDAFLRSHGYFPRYATEVQPSPTDVSRMYNSGIGKKDPSSQSYALGLMAELHAVDSSILTVYESVAGDLRGLDASAYLDTIKGASSPSARKSGTLRCIGGSSAFRGLSLVHTPNDTKEAVDLIQCLLGISLESLVSIIRDTTLCEQAIHGVRSWIDPGESYSAEAILDLLISRIMWRRIADPLWVQPATITRLPHELGEFNSVESFVKTLESSGLSFDKMERHLIKSAFFELVNCNAYIYNFQSFTRCF